jgi:GTPase SAR1 family protein
MIEINSASSEPNDSSQTFAVGFRSDHLVNLLAHAAVSLSDVWAPASPNLLRFRNLQERLREGRFHLAILGQFKRGKSTFLNALLGEELLPAGIIPLTAIPTFVAWAPTPLIRATYRTSRAHEEFHDSAPENIRRHLFDFVAEEANPKNRLDVARVELFYPANILQQGVVLIDTPGIGSTHRHNTDTALQILPECDAAVFVVSADPPITEAEIEYLKVVRARVARLIFVLNKADYLEPIDRRIAVDFLHKTLQGVFPADTSAPIFCLSALKGLKAKQLGDEAAFAASGMASMEDYLLRYLTREKTGLLRVAVIKKASDLLAEAAADLAIRVRTLEMPIEDLEKRRAILAESLERIEDEKRVIRDFLTGDRRRTVEQLEIDAERIRQNTRRRLLDILDLALSQFAPGTDESGIRETIATAIPDIFERELSETAKEFGQKVEELLNGHQCRVDALIGRVRQTAADLFDIPFRARAEAEPFKLRQEPYWVTEKWNDTLISVPDSFVRRLLPIAARRARIKRQLELQISELVERNVENLRWTMLQSLDDAFRRFASEFDERLTMAIEATHGAADAASRKRHKASERVDLELVQLHHLSETLAAAGTELVSFQNDMEPVAVAVP